MTHIDAELGHKPHKPGKVDDPVTHHGDPKDKDKDGKPAEPEEPPFPLKIKCCCCLTYPMAASLIGGLDILGLIGFIGVVIYLKNLCDSWALSTGFGNILIVFPILTIIFIFTPRSIAFLIMQMNKKLLSRRKMQYVCRSITTVLMFILYLIVLVILILLYKGTEVVALTTEDLAFIASDIMKWTVILLAIILVVGTLFDLYFSLAVRTFYLNLMYYPDHENPNNPKNKYQMDLQQHNTSAHSSYGSPAHKASSNSMV